MCPWERAPGLASEPELLLGATWRHWPHPLLSSQTCPEAWEGPGRVPAFDSQGSRQCWSWILAKVGKQVQGQLRREVW